MTFATQKKRLQRGVRAARKFVSKKHTQASDFLSDSGERLQQRIYAKRSPESAGKYMERKHQGIQHVVDGLIIWRATDVSSDESCKRGILEACALQMSNRDRRRLLVSMGFPTKDTLSKHLRGNKIPSTRSPMDGYDRMILQQCFREVEWGEKILLKALFKIISANPSAFCRLVLP